MRMQFGIMAVMVFILGAATVTAEEKQGKGVIVALIGDSTVMDNGGWGKAFADRFNDQVKVLNFAASGASSKSFHEDKRLSAVLEAKPDYVLIQFGHNDQPKQKGPHRKTDPATTFRDFLRIYINKTREIGVKPILVSPVCRRTFGADGKLETTLTPWADAMKAVAGEMKVPFIDLHSISMAYHNNIGKEATMAFNRGSGDMTHLSPKGAEGTADLIVRELKNVAKDLAAYLTKCRCPGEVITIYVQ